MGGRHAVLIIQMSQQTRVTLQGWLQRQKTPLGRAKRAIGANRLPLTHSRCANLEKASLPDLLALVHHEFSFLRVLRCLDRIAHIRHRGILALLKVEA
jgi:hypothetical protein